LVIPLLSALFGAISGTTIGAVVPMAVFGLAWGVLIAIIAPRLTRFGARPSVWAELPLWVAVSLAFIVLGGALLGDFLAVTPQDQMQILQFSRFGIYFAVIHTIFELLLMPLVQMLNWNRPGRRELVVGAAVVFYLRRAVSALYFAPMAIAWGNNPSLATLDEVQLWMNLNWVRSVGQDGITAVLLLLAALRSIPSYARAASTGSLQAAPL